MEDRLIAAEEANRSLGITVDIDTGGTFTDGVVGFRGGYFNVKVLTTPHDLTVCFVSLLKKAAEACGFTDDLVGFLKNARCIRYSTTIGTNTVIQRKGPKIGLILSSGAEKDIYGGLGKNGESALLRALLSEDAIIGIRDVGDKADAIGAINRLLNNGAERLVVSLKGAASAPDQERQLKSIIMNEYPRHLLGAIPLLFSHELTRDENDFRRTATSVLNAYLHPALEHFLYKAEDILRSKRYRNPLIIFRSDSGSSRVSKTAAIMTYNSGPAGGVQGIRSLSRLFGIPHLAGIDIGGTSTDISFVLQGQSKMQQYGEVEDIPVSFPMLEIYSIAAGGGSIASVENNVLKVGPESASSSPGPACMGLGGTQATLTDADMLLGILDAEYFLGGEVLLHPDRAERAIRENVSDLLGISPVEGASRIRTEIEKKIGETVQAHIREENLDAGDFALVAFGGAGPTHACGAAEAAGIRRIVIPPFASTFSAFGISFSDVRHDYEVPLSGPETSPISAAYAQLYNRALRDMKGEGFSENQVTLEARVEYKEGDALLFVPLKIAKTLEHGHLATLFPGSKAEKRSAYRLCLSASSSLPHYKYASNGRARKGKAKPRKTVEVCWSGNRRVPTPVFHQEDCSPGTILKGPALLHMPSTTVTVLPGWMMEVDRYSHIQLTREGGAS